jgi:hypothetical protein
LDSGTDIVAGSALDVGGIGVEEDASPDGGRDKHKILINLINTINFA